MPADADQDFANMLLRRTVASLQSVDAVDRIWRRGLVHRGGPHYRLTGTTGPVTIGEDECLILARIIARFRPANCLIIGNGFGLSSAFITGMMEATGGESVVTLDNMSEGDGARCAHTAEALRRQLNCRILCNRYGVSPRDVDVVAGHRSYDLVFIDGGHSHPQVVNDYRGIRRLLARGGIVCWHDYWLAGVSESVAFAERDGLRCLKINSSCEVVLGTRDETRFEHLSALYTDAEPPIPRLHPIARLTLSRSSLMVRLRTQFRAPTAARHFSHGVRL